MTRNRRFSLTRSRFKDFTSTGSTFARSNSFPMSVIASGIFSSQDNLSSFRFSDGCRHVKSGSLFFSSMGKKQKNSRRPSELSSGQLEKEALDHMAAARFRQARDTYKILCKQDPAEIFAWTHRGQ